MPTPRTYLAFDMGAESGRVVAGSFDGQTLTLDVIHRFPTGPVPMPDGYHWNLPGQFMELKSGLAEFVKTSGGGPASIGVDTWGVDYGLVGERNGLVGLPYQYRDSRTDGLPEKVFETLSKEAIYAITGTQTMPINTIFQLVAARRDTPKLLSSADTLLMMGWLFTYLFSGAKAGEFTLASTSQLYDLKNKRWSPEIFDALNLPIELMPELVDCGTVVGDIRGDIAEETACGKVPVVMVGCHDTSMAVAAIPAETESRAFLSSGTWSLMGFELPQPILTREALDADFTNEGCVNGDIRFLTNLVGLWIVQECRRQWEREGEELTYDEITAMAMAAESFQTTVIVDDPAFMKPGDMPNKVAEHCRRLGQPEPKDKGALLRAVFEGLALKYREVLDRAKAVTNRSVSVLHAVGGGSQNRLLNQFTADALGIPVVTGPVEATAAGNVLTQAMALGDIGSVDEMRAVIRASFDVETFEPQETDVWAERYAAYRAMKEKLEG